MRTLPDVLEPYRAAIEATRLPILAVDFEEAPPADLMTSRIGGMPWWPAGRPYPTDQAGRPLLLLIQINFAETPPLEPFPHRGLLQLFIGTDDHYGCEFDMPVRSPGFRAVYHATMDAPQLGVNPLLAAKPTLYTPLEEPLVARALRFELSSMTIDAGDYRFEKVLPEIAASEDLVEAYYETQVTPAIRLGGYPSFTQTDPRAYSGADALGDFTLLTIDTTDGIMWGDSGVAQFFMHESDLAARDFSKVAYTWDCC